MFQDTYSVDFDRLGTIKSNITSLRLIDPNTTEIRMVAEDWKLGQPNHDHHIRVTPESIRVRKCHRPDSGIFMQLGNYKLCTVYASLILQLQLSPSPLKLQTSKLYIVLGLFDSNKEETH